METFYLNQGELYAEHCSLKKIAEELGTPCYVYSRASIEKNWNAFDSVLKLQNFPHQIYYAVKANSNLSLLNILAKLGSGFDIVSEGELFRVLKAGGDPKKIVFSGVGKSERELRLAVSKEIGCINIESEAELRRLMNIAKEFKKKVPIAFRGNPDIAANSHPYISTGQKENKFGIEFELVKQLYLEAKASPYLDIQGFAFHIGSQITSLSPFILALEKALILIDELQAFGIPIHNLSVGGGLGVRYSDETPPTPEDYILALRETIGDRKLTLHLEPGRAVVATAGALLTRVEYLKNNFAIVDASMNDLLRPALYGAYQSIVPVCPRQEAPTQLYDIVGPICETGDFLGKDRALALEAGDLLAVLSTGAYGFSMSSNYNSRPRAAEVLIDKEEFHTIRSRETIESLFAAELFLKN